MCYHVSTPDKRKLIEELPQYKINLDDESFYHVSGFTRPFLPVTTSDNPRTVENAQWKLIPYWIKTEAEAKAYANTCNAKSEEVFDKASYKIYIEKNRGLLWIDGFFEPHKNKVSGKDENYYIYLPEKRIFTLGIVISPWVNTETGEVTNTFSILTTKANKLLEEIHNEKKRMPLVIAPDDRDEWLEARGKAQIQHFFKPFNGLLEAHKVHRVTADRTGSTNRSDIQEKIE